MPEATAPSSESVIVAVNVTVVPKATDVPGAAESTVCVGAGLTVWLTEFDVLLTKLVEPANTAVIVCVPPGVFCVVSLATPAEIDTKPSEILFEAEGL